MENLKKIFILNAEIERNNKTINELRRMSVSMDLKNAYEHLLEEQTEELLKAKLNAEKEINEISDDTARLIAKYKYIDALSWSEIGRKMNYDRTSVYRYLKRFLKLHEIHGKKDL